MGWDLALMAMGLHFKTSATVDPKEAERWTASDAGRPFVVGCSESWAEASIAAGNERDSALAAASRVSDFYSPTSQGS